MTPRPDAQPKLKFAPHLAQWALVLWVLFLLWSVLAAVVMPLQIGDLMVQRWFGSPTAHRTGPGLAVVWLLWQFDLIWILLAFANLYFFTVRTDGLAAARRWFAVLLGGTFGMAALTTVGGSVVYGQQRLGWKFFGLVPVGVPLFWTVMVLSAFYTVRFFFAKAGRPLPVTLHAVLTGVLTALTALNLDRIATFFRHYWRAEHSTAPYWGLAALALCFALRGGRVAPTLTAEPVVIFCAFNLVYLLVHCFA